MPGKPNGKDRLPDHAPIAEGYGASDARAPVPVPAARVLPGSWDPPDGRYLLRAAHDGEPEHVIVLATLNARGAASRRCAASRRLGAPAARRRRPLSRSPSRARSASARATIVDPVSVSAERQAQRWLPSSTGEREVLAAVGGAQPRAVRRTDRRGRPLPYTRSHAGQASDPGRLGRGRAGGRRRLAARARALPRGGPRRARLGGEVARRAAALRPQERLAELLGAHAARAAVRGARPARAAGPRPGASRARGARARRAYVPRCTSSRTEERRRSCRCASTSCASSRGVALSRLLSRRSRSTQRRCRRRSARVSSAPGRPPAPSASSIGCARARAAAARSGAASAHART